MRSVCGVCGAHARRRACAATIAAEAATTAMTVLCQPHRRNSSSFIDKMFMWTLPYSQRAHATTKEELEQQRFFTQRPRDKWDYQRIDDNINTQSAFRRTAGREEFFQGDREDNSTLNAASTHTPHKYNLYDHFDAYTQPGMNTKWAAVEAVKEQWDADEFYYPGEAWRRNRPGFRSVPKEMLNRHTWYHWSAELANMHKIMPLAQPRAWCPSWPPPGYRVPTFATKHEYAFGGDDPALMAEMERLTWFRAWMENNFRYGPYEVISLATVFTIMYIIARHTRSADAMREMCAGTYFPGMTFMRPYGVPRDFETEPGWWQRPLEQFPNPVVVWFYRNQRFKYIDYIKARDAREQALAAAETDAAAAATAASAAEVEVTA